MKIEIGGIEYEADPMFRDIEKIFVRQQYYSKIDARLKGKGKMLNWSYFFFWVMLKIIPSSGKFFWKKPFRTAWGIHAAIKAREYQPAVNAVAKILRGLSADPQSETKQ